MGAPPKNHFLQREWENIGWIKARGPLTNKSCSLKCCNIHRKTPGLESLFNKDSNRDVFCE